MSSIRERRTELGMSQKELARRSGIDARTLRKIENGEHVSDLSIAAVESILGISAPRDAIRHDTLTPTISPAALMTFLKFTAPISLVLFWYFLGDNPETWIPAFVLCLVISLPAIALAALLTSTPQGNTRITVSGAISTAETIKDPRQRARQWLGREDVFVKAFKVAENDFEMVVSSEYKPSEYASLSKRLSEFGLKVQIATS